MTSGIVLVNKPEGITSAAVVSRLRKVLNIKRIGHAGTLDPMASGLLVCLVGNATRLAQFAEKGEKIYSGSIHFGRTTDSDDRTGNTLEESNKIPSADRVIECSKSFLGDIMQVPPQVSALKINGERAYKLARKGESVPLKARPTCIYQFEIDQVNNQIYKFLIRCSVGTYIRSIARDLGALLGCGGNLFSLVREGSLPFELKDASSLDQIGSHSILPWTVLFPLTKQVLFPQDTVRSLKNGDLRAASTEIFRYLKDTDQLHINRLIYRASEGATCDGLLIKQSDGTWQIGVNYLGS